MLSRCLILGLSAAVMVGCSSSKKELPPAELEKFNAEVELDRIWKRNVGVGQGDLYNNLTPALDGLTLYAADAKGRVVALERETGKEKWEVKLKEPLSGAVGAGGGLVLVGTLDGQVITLDEADGSEKWRAQVSSEVLAAPQTNGDVVVVQTQDDKLVGLDISNGERRWIYESTLPVLTVRGHSEPVVDVRQVFAGLASGKVVALSAETGIPMWEQRVAQPTGRSELERMVDIDGRLLLDDQTLYVVSYQGNVAALDAQSGRPLWQHAASSYVGPGAGFGSVYISEADGTVQALDAGSATELWSTEALARRQLTAPVAFSNFVAVGDFEGYLHLLGQTDGRMAGRVRVDGDGLRAAPLTVGDLLFVYGNSGDLAAYKLK
ncbi:MAG TPA: outer membrane protein assembly factor BamB [Pseudomonas sp.]|jgi:outer membrane protein assembly factor BamB|uniref:Outer membrane protein assembly factor BamB n=1 Tax=Halopseudomonas pachastrellae TaxID=254161 RepID=A0A1S8DFU8_9GAMM|nr:outer membrane protein assembly factor BamB [Halopseudomonas pachastrellae]MAQ49604.1 outer membrane protein assembly factor BamB [Pseudomonas sp.]MBB50434.1 outer membrane protein assembly factor BamB [Pseudomonadales bacterium]MED5493392.1 outer membrane protein assembly factor BamB [Pseudomonadota bacterium]MBF76666.1 outer membrane protein assembly factor BamB [Pseudomonadales bacterium]MBU31776.1 outer membrane protein assembly factor BamB [Pseudomonadales bacterium]